VTAYIFAPAFLVIAWWKRGHIDWHRDALPLVPIFVLSLVVGLIIGWLEVHHVGAKGADFQLGLPDRVVLAGQLIWWYVGKLLWPYPLCVLYERWTIDASLWWEWLGFGAFLFVTIALWRYASRGVLAACLLFLGSLFPVLGILNVYGMKLSWAADRWVYMGALPVFAIFSALLARVPSRFLRVGAQILILVACAILTWRQASLYRTADTFWLAAISGSKRPYVAHNCY
jgi:hypothetical protein